MAFRGRLAALQQRPLPAPVLADRKGESTITVSSSGRVTAPSSINLYALDIDEKRTKEERKLQLQRNIEREEELTEMKLLSASISLYSFERMKDLSVCEIENAELEGRGSINDSRMGTPDRGCATCDKLQCAGHFGLIRFATRTETGDIVETPIYHPLMIRDIIKVLNSVCNCCGALMVTREYLAEKKIDRLSGPARLTEIEAVAKKMKCVEKVEHRQSLACGDGKTCASGEAKEHMVTEGPLKKCVPNPIYITEGASDKDFITYYVDKRDKVTRGGRKARENEGPAVGAYSRTVDEVFCILDAISDKDAELMGFRTYRGAHPRNMIMRGWMVTPPSSRPPKVQDSEFKPHNITIAYQDIVKAKLEIDNIIKGTVSKKRTKVRTDKSEKNALDAARTKLFKTVYKLLENKDSSRGRGSHLIPLSQLIQGKEALVRNMMMGKRGDFCGRSVLAGDPSLKFGEISIPLKFAKVLTQAEHVTTFNIDRLRALHKNGRLTHIELGVAHKQLRKFRRPILPSDVIRVGDIVERWLQDGDIVIFNRQPTLHKESMMAYRVIVKDQLVIGLHMSPSGPHNYDFDGDEGAIYIPVGYAAKFEASEIMNVVNCTMSAQQNRPMMGLPYNAPLAAYKLTDPLTEVDEVLYNDCLLAITYKGDLDTLDDRLKKMKVPKYSGRALFSSLLPAGFTYLRGKVSIYNGVLVAGNITAADISTDHRSIIQEMFKSYGSGRTATFLTDATFVLGRWLEQNPETISIRDLDPGNPEIKSIKAADYTNIRLNVEALGNKQDDPLLEAARERNILANVKTAKSLGLKMANEVFAGPREKTLALEKKLTPAAKELISALAAERTTEQTVSDEKGELKERKENIPTALAKLKAIAADLDMFQIRNHREIMERAIIRLTGILPERYLESITKYSELPVALQHTQEIIKGEGAKAEKAQEAYELIVEELRLINEVHDTNRQVQELGGQSDNRTIEASVSALSKAVKAAANLLRPSDNSLAISTELGSGAKGSALNIAQIRGSVGQQHYRGGRLPATLAGGKCLPNDDTSLQSRGFICNSFYEGLTTEQFLSLMTGGRESLLAIATSVSQSGSIQHKMIKAMEGLVVRYDGSMRNHRNAIFQCVAGTDGFDPAQMIKINMPGFDTLASFIDLESEAASLNVEYGYVPI